MQEKAYWLGWQILLPGTPRRIWELVERFGSAREAWRASEQDLIATGGFSQESSASLAQRKTRIRPEEEIVRLQKVNTDYILYSETSYPKILKNIFDPPPGLFVRGRLPNEASFSVAIVGSRRPTPYGLAVAEKLALELAQNGVVIVSGLARGVDSAAHQGALAAKGINIAVLGCGVDVVYPRENRVLLEQIIATGAVISEYPLGSPPEAWHFPQRNRIISGLAKATLVVEAGERSGALITADCALEQGREVLAVPGNISSPASKGPNRLIKQGAGLVESVEDILEEIGAGTLFKADIAKTPPLPRLTAEEEKVYRQLSHASVHLDDLASRSNLPVQDVLAVLMYLELKGLVRQLPGKFYTLRLYN